MTEADFDPVVNVHLKSVDERWWPHVNISSGLTRVSAVGSSASTAAKVAVEALTRYLAKRPDGVSGSMVRDNPEVNKQVSAMTACGVRDCRMTSGP
jgi:NAD(P)-dependent dehydrogenase (short-subunit alcohol dehydrogenase family)